jgi:glycosyltransferase involved in cell wall biosynthesis
LVLLSKNFRFANKNNIFATDWVSNETLKDLQNKAFIHICPSCYEGFGHYINEALSVGAVVVTTDADPMREFVQNGNGFLVKTSGTIHKDLAIMHSVRSEAIRETIRQVEATGDNTLIKMGQAGRELFLKNDKLFKERFLQLIFEI